MRNNATTKLGIARPMLVAVTLARSTLAPGRIPERIPSGIPIRMLTKRPASATENGDRDALLDLLGDGRAALVEQRRPEVELHRVDEPVAVALEDGAVEAELGPDLGDPLGGGVGAAGEGRRRVAGDQLREHEHDERDDQQDRDEAQEPADDQGEHAAPRLAHPVRWPRHCSGVPAHASDRRGRRRQNDAGPTRPIQDARGAHMPGELDLDELAARATAAAQSWVPGCVIDDVQPLTGGASSLTFTGRVDGRTARGASASC